MKIALIDAPPELHVSHGLIRTDLTSFDAVVIHRPEVSLQAVSDTLAEHVNFGIHDLEQVPCPDASS